MSVRGLIVLIFAAPAFWLSGGAVAVPPSALSTSCQTPDANLTIPPTTCFFDLTGYGSTTLTPPSLVLNGGVFRVPGTSEDLGQGYIVGTGVFQPFVRIQEPANGNGNGIEAGYNTDGRDGVGPLGKELDNHDKGGTNWNHSIRLSAIPRVTVCDGGGTTGSNCEQYYEFLLDTNEQGSSPNSGISLDEFKVFTAATGDIHNFTGADDTKGFTNFQLTGADLRYDMDGPNPYVGDPTTPAGVGGDASILTDYRNFSGSGNGVDLQALVRVDNFVGVAPDAYVYLYSKFGWTAAQCQQSGNGDSPCLEPDGTPGPGRPISTAAAPTPAGTLNFSADAGFEEWSIRKTGNTVSTPVPSTLLLLGIGLAGLAYRRRLSTV